MELCFWAATDVGRKREHNEDNFLVDKKLSLFVVADGMGGHASGEVASRHRGARVPQRGRREPRHHRALRQGRRHACARRTSWPSSSRRCRPPARPSIHKGQAEPDKRGMGTTTSALLIAGDRGFIAHVGDSRIYLVRRARSYQLTEDHSLVNELIRRGKITKESSRARPTRLQERGHPRGRRLRERRGRHDRLRDPARRPVPALLGRPARLPEGRSASSSC